MVVTIWPSDMRKTKGEKMERKKKEKKKRKAHRRAAKQTQAPSEGHKGKTRTSFGIGRSRVKGVGRLM